MQALLDMAASLPTPATAAATTDVAAFAGPVTTTATAGAQRRSSPRLHDDDLARHFWVEH
jgi:hypothetical protein